MPAHHRIAEVEIPKAELLADYYGIGQDLEAASNWCEKALANARTASKDLWLIEALVTAAIVKYCRCFSSGARFGLRRRDIESIGDRRLVSHDYIKALRDKFIAHPVNPYDESYVTVVVTEREGRTNVGDGVNLGHTRMVLSVSEAEQLKELVDAVRVAIQPSIEAEEQKVIEAIKELPTETVSKWDLHTPNPMKPEDVTKSRKRT